MALLKKEILNSKHEIRNKYKSTKYKCSKKIQLEF
jgi:hypothetical protein